MSRPPMMRSSNSNGSLFDAGSCSGTCTTTSSSLFDAGSSSLFDAGSNHDSKLLDTTTSDDNDDKNEGRQRQPILIRHAIRSSTTNSTSRKAKGDRKKKENNHNSRKNNKNMYKRTSSCGPSILHQFSLKARENLSSSYSSSRHLQIDDRNEENDDDGGGDESSDFNLDKLNLSQVEMAGRDEEMSQLLDIFRTVVLQTNTTAKTTTNDSSPNRQNNDPRTKRIRGPATLVSIYGGSGTGKSFLARSLRSHVIKSTSGYFAFGKFDINNTSSNVPYSGFVQAFNMIIEQILQLPQQQQLQEQDVTRMKEISKRIRRAIGGKRTSRIITSVVPLLSTLLAVGKEETDDISEDVHRESQAEEEEKREADEQDDPSDSEDSSSGGGGNSVKTKLKQLQYTFRQFARALCRDGSPVVIVLDDIQWADVPSLELLETLMTDVENPLFMIITTCRTSNVRGSSTGDGTSKDVGNTMPPFLCMTLPKFQKQGVIVHPIQIGNLHVKAIESIVTTALRLSSLSAEEETRSSSSAKTSPRQLATIIHEKTHGNAFFVIQFIKSLKLKHLLTFNYGTMAWTWNIKDIQNLKVTENVADLLLSNYGMLSKRSQVMLQVASLLGQRFDGTVFVTVMEKVEHDIRNDNGEHDGSGALPQGGGNGDDDDNCLSIDRCLDCLVHGGFLNQRGSQYTFVHDQIQDMALKQISSSSSLMPLSSGSASNRQIMERKIGEHLLEYATDNGNDQLLFLAVELLNASASILGPTEKLGLAKYNLLAGRLAMKKAAFASCRGYLESGLACVLGESNNGGDDDTRQMKQNEAWSNHYNLLLDLSVGAAESSYCNGEFDKMEQHLVRVIKSAATPFEDKIRAYLTRILSYGVQERFGEAIDTGLFVLREMGMATFPRNPSKVSVLMELLKTRRVLKTHTLESLSKLPVLGDKKRELAMGLIHMMSSMAYVSCPNLHFIAYFKATRWSIKYGLCKYSPPAIARCAILVNAVLGKTDEAFMLGEASLAIDERLKARETSAKTIAAVYGYVAHWSKSLHTLEKPLLYGQQIGFETGEVDMACHCMIILGLSRFFTASRPLDMLSRDIESHVHTMKEHKQDTYVGYLSVLWQTVLCLSGKSENPMKLTGKAMDEDRVYKVAIETKNRLLMGMMHSLKMQLAYLLGDYKAAASYAALTSDFGVSVGQGAVLIPAHFFYRGLSMAALSILGKDTRKNTQGAQQAMKTLQKWSSKGNVNCLHMVKLLEAELAVIRNKPNASDLYKEAVNVAGRNGFMQDKGLAHYRSALFHLSKNDSYWASYNLDNAIQCFHDWGATAVSSHLVATHGSFLQNAECSSEFIRKLVANFSTTQGQSKEAPVDPPTGS